MEARPEDNYCALPLEAPQSLTALMGKTTPESTISGRAFVIRSPIAYYRQPVLLYQSVAILRSDFLTLLTARLGATIRGFRRHIVGRNEISNANAHLREPLLPLRVLIQGSFQMGVVAP
jgi:hypothetical protein